MNRRPGATPAPRFWTTSSLGLLSPPEASGCMGGAREQPSERFCFQRRCGGATVAYIAIADSHKFRYPCFRLLDPEGPLSALQARLAGALRRPSFWAPFLLPGCKPGALSEGGWRREVRILGSPPWRGSTAVVQGYYRSMVAGSNPAPATKFVVRIVDGAARIDVQPRHVLQDVPRCGVAQPGQRARFIPFEVVGSNPTSATK